MTFGSYLFNCLIVFAVVILPAYGFLLATRPCR